MFLARKGELVVTHHRLIATAASMLVLLTPAPRAGADPGASTHVDSIEAVLSGSSITVSGQATFVGSVGLLAQDPEGDARVPGIGADITNVSIQPSGPGGAALLFRMGISDPIEDLEGIPEAVLYQWIFRVQPTGSQNTPQYMLQALRTSQFQDPGSTEPSFRLWSGCSSTGLTPNCALGDPVVIEGRIEEGSVDFIVPISFIGAQNGGAINTNNGIWTRTGASGLAWNTLGLDNVVSEVSYALPVPRLSIGVAPAGTPPSSVATPFTGTLTAAGDFSATISAPQQPGDYIVVARACFEEGAPCALGSTTLKV